MSKTIVARINPDVNIIFVRSWRESRCVESDNRVPSLEQTSTCYNHEQKEVFSAVSKVVMIMGNHFTFQDGRSRTAFSKTTATQFSFYFVSRHLATGQSEIVLRKTHPIVLKTVL